MILIFFPFVTDFRWQKNPERQQTSWAKGGQKYYLGEHPSSWVDISYAFCYAASTQI